MDRRSTPANGRVVADWAAGDHPGLIPVTPDPHFVAQPVADICRGVQGARDRQMLYGWPFDVLDRRDGWAFGISRVMDYVGWVQETALRPVADRPEAATWIGTRQSRAYSEPDFKSRDLMALSHLSILSMGRMDGRFTETEIGWVPSAHLENRSDSDPVAMAELYLGADYLWGGNGAFGLDCSGLVKAALLACGVNCPGDSDQQQAAFSDATGGYQRGDLLFWKGHVAMVVDDTTLIHANAHHMAVVNEGIDAAIARIDRQGDGPVTAHKRP